MPVTSFQVNCTLPPTEVNYVSSANVRGTLNILWSSLSIIALCTWSIQHLNVPIRSRPQTKRQKIGQKVLHFERKVRWMLINAIIPEIALAKAASDLAAAKSVTPEFTSLAERDRVDWTLAHSFFADMGGFAIRFPDNSQKTEEEWKEENDKEGEAAAVGDELVNVRNRFHSHHNRSDEENQLQQTVSINSSMVGHISLQKLSGEKNLTTSHKNSGLSDSDNSHIDGEAGQAEAKTESNNDQKSEYQHIKIRYTSSGVAVNVTNMPEHLQYLVFDKMSGVGAGLDAYESLIKGLQPWIGQVDWNIDCENRKTVISALESVTSVTFEHHKIGWFYNVLPLQGNVWVPDASQLLLARKQGIIDSLPSLPTERLDDLSKAGTLLKLITLAQIVWLIVQLIVRKTENLTTMPLEISVLAFAAISLVTYVTLWNKPQDIQTCFYTTAVRRPSQAEVDSIGLLGPRAIGLTRSHPWIPSNCFEMKSHAGRMFMAGLITAAITFGGLHCLAWNSHFPTPIERLLWRISSIYITVSIFFSTSIGALLVGLRRISKRFGELGSGAIFSAHEVIYSSFLFLTMLGYILCRLFMTVEIFRSLSYRLQMPL
uniref:Uncharacterized protein n=1 Tax=Talaromyces marneffei PM1 TaxID=1077442 RepID=A0A093V6L0_TALMA